MQKKKKEKRKQRKDSLLLTVLKKRGHAMPRGALHWVSRETEGEGGTRARAFIMVSTRVNG